MKRKVENEKDEGKDIMSCAKLYRGVFLRAPSVWGCGEAFVYDGGYEGRGRDSELQDDIC